MRNILIKTISSIILVFLFTIVSIAQREVVFVHGFNSEGGTWTKYRNWLLTTAGSTVSSDIPKDYIWYNGIQNFANDVSRQNTPAVQKDRNIMIGHSTGGAVLRNLDLDGKFIVGEHGIITVGAPLAGAAIANAFRNGQIDNFAQEASIKLLAGPEIQGFAFPGSSVALNIIGGAFGTFTIFGLPGIIKSVVKSILGIDKGSDTVIDLAENSAFFQNDAQKLATSTHKVSIYGEAYDPQLFRFVGSSFWKNESRGLPPTDLSPGDNADGFVNTINVTKAIYAAAAAGNAATAGWFTVSSFFDFGASAPVAAYFWASSIGWFIGFDWLDDGGNRGYLGLIDANSWQQTCYNYYSNTCTNQHYYGDCYALGQRQGIQWQFSCHNDCWQTRSYCITSPANSVSDGFIKGNSAIGFGLQNWNAPTLYRVQNVNHNEETNNSKMESTYNSIFFNDLGYFKLK